MKWIASLSTMLLLLAVCTLSIALAQGSFTLEQSSLSNGAVSSGGPYRVRDAIGEPGVGSASAGAYQVIGGLAFGRESAPGATFTLNVTTSGSGTVTLNPPGGLYPAGTVVQLTATPATGFAFTSWGGAVTGTANPVSLIMDGNKTVSVTFTATSTVVPDQHLYLPLIDK